MFSLPELIFSFIDALVRNPVYYEKKNLACDHLDKS